MRIFSSVGGVGIQKLGDGERCRCLQIVQLAAVSVAHGTGHVEHHGDFDCSDAETRRRETGDGLIRIEGPDPCQSQLLVDFNLSRHGLRSHIQIEVLERVGGRIEGIVAHIRREHRLEIVFGRIAGRRDFTNGQRSACRQRRGIERVVDPDLGAERHRIVDCKAAGQKNERRRKSEVNGEIAILVSEESLGGEP